MEGIEMEGSDESESDPNLSSKGDTDDLAATKDVKKKKSTKSKRKEALEKKAADQSKSKNDPTVVADFSREDSASDNPDGSRREMLNQADTVRADDEGDERRGPVGSNRFNADDGGADELP